MSSRSIRAVVFDLDGTLVDSLADIATHLNEALADHGLERRSRAEIAEWVGYGAEQLVMRAVPRGDLVAPVLATFRARYRSRPVIDSQLYGGIADVLDALAPRYQLAVLSNKPHELTVDVARALLSRWPFAVIAGQRPNHPHKPDPQALRDVAVRLGGIVPAEPGPARVDQPRHAGLGQQRPPPHEARGDVARQELDGRDGHRHGQIKKGCADAAPDHDAELHPFSCAIALRRRPLCCSMD